MESDEPTRYRREEKLDYRYGEPFSDEDDVQWVTRTHKRTGHVEVVACEYYEEDEWGSLYYNPHAPDSESLLTQYFDFLPQDLRRVRRLEIVHRKGDLVCLAAVLGTVRHPLFWRDEQTREVYLAASFDAVGEKLPDAEELARRSTGSPPPPALDVRYRDYLPSDLRRGIFRPEPVRRKGPLVCFAAVVGTVRHAAFWLDEQTGDVFAAASFERVGERLPTGDALDAWFAPPV